MAGWLQQQHSRSFPLKQLPSQAAHSSTVMGAHQSLAATVTGAGPHASENQPPTTVEMTDGRVVSFEEYLQQCSDRFLPVRAPRASRASAAHDAVSAAKSLRGVTKQPRVSSAHSQIPRDSRPQPKRSSELSNAPAPAAAPPPAVAIDLSHSKLSKSAKKCIETVMSYDNLCCQFIRDEDSWIEQLPLPEQALTRDVRLPQLRMGKFVLTHARPIGQGTSGIVLRGWMAGRAVALKIQYEKCPGLAHDMCRNAYSHIWRHIAPDAGLGDWFGFCIGRVPWSRETVYMSLMQFYEHLLDKVMEGCDGGRTVADCGGAARLAACVGLAMLPVMDGIHVQGKAYADMKPHNIALDAAGRPFLIDVGQLANQGPTGGKLGTQFWQPLRKQAGQGVFCRDDIESLLWVVADIVWGGGFCIWNRVAPEPRKILEARRRFLDENFSAGRRAEAAVQGLILELLQLPLHVGRVDAAFMHTCTQSLSQLL